MTKDLTTVQDGLVVGLDYTLRLDDGQVIDTTTDGDPLQFLQGGQQIIPGLEKALYGMAVGDEKDVELAPKEGYGQRNPDAVELVPPDAFPADLELTEGMGLQLRDPSGREVVAYVAEIRPDAVVLDLNHPLAGEKLFFEVKVANLRPATQAELDHGHAHGAEHEH